ncbi:hypothetical protein ACFZA1_00030 [Streptomyces filipinensis]|uniref:hypothetical protein n=1 Tax=Streptomyces filipinensis TaxID=66887 RepID=UPI0036E1DFFC
MNTERPENREHPEGSEQAGSAGSHEGVEDSGNPEPKPATTRDAPTGDGAGGSLEAGAPEADGTDGGRAAPHRSRLAVVSVAAAVLLVGGGGAYLAASGDSGGRTAGDGAPPPPLALDGFRGTGGIAPGEPDPYGARYVARGELPAGPGSAPVYAPKGEVGKDAVARLARALGVEGTPVAQGRIWRVGGGDGFGPSLQVNRDASGSWSYSRSAPGTDDCKKGVLCAHDPMAPLGTPVSVAAAEKAAAPVLKAAGLDGAKIDASQVMGSQRVVNADPVVGGLPTYGWTTGLTVDRRGELVGGYGLLGTAVKGDTYPVLSAAKTLKLMNAAPKGDHRMGIGGCASPMPLKDRLEQPCGSSTGVAQQGADPGTETVTVDKAVFGLASHSVAGRRTLVPSWLFGVREPAGQGASTVAYPAVDPRSLASSATPSAPTASAAPTRTVQVTGYTAAGRELTVSFAGGVCADYKVSARESAERVTVTVTERPWPGKVCVLIAKEYVKTVRLAAPLDGRTVVGDDGRPVPQVKPGALRPDASAQPRR